MKRQVIILRMKPHLLAAVDEAAERHGLTRTAMLDRIIGDWTSGETKRVEMPIDKQLVDAVEARAGKHIEDMIPALLRDWLMTRR